MENENNPQDTNASDTQASNNTSSTTVLWLKNNSSNPLDLISKYGEITVDGHDVAGPFNIPADEEEAFRRAPFLAKRPWLIVITDEEHQASLNAAKGADKDADAGSTKKPSAKRSAAPKK